MDIGQRIPDLSDKELENLHANAVRLSQSGSLKKKEQAEHLLPLIGAALETRRTARVEAEQERRRTTKRRKAVAAKAKTL
ncbi:MAG: hypothetical protein AB7P07_09960 [Hyphomonadaceae bacterium]